VEESGASQPLRDVRICPIYEGTTAIQANDLIERKIVRDGGAALRAWLLQVHLTLNQLACHEGGEFQCIESGLRKGVDALQQTAEWALAQYRDNQLQVLAGAVPFLQMCGTVAGGWQMARAALAVQRDLAQGIGNIGFLRAKLVSAHFYAAHLLPRAPGFANIVMYGGNSVLAMNDADF
jgi:hypothetical protein